MRRMLLFVLVILAIAGCSASETKWDYKGYIIDIFEVEESMVYQIMWGISEEDVKTKTIGELTEFNSDKIVFVEFDENDNQQNSFQVGDKVLVQVNEEIQYRFYKLKKIELDTSDEQ